MPAASARYVLVRRSLTGDVVGGLPVMTLARGPLGQAALHCALARRSEADRFLFRNQAIDSSRHRRGRSRSPVAQQLLGPRLCASAWHDDFRRADAGTRLGLLRPGEPVRAERFWRFPPPVPRRETLDEAAERLRFAWKTALRCMPWPICPVGAFLSGGIDSTGIVAIMRKHVADLRTYTLRFPELTGQDESQFAIETADKLACRNTVVDVTGSEVRDLLPTFAGQIDQPSIDGLNTWIISRAAAHDVKAVLSGVGGDEWFAGYPVTRRMARYSQTLMGQAQLQAGKVAHFFRNMLPEGALRQRVDNLATCRLLVDTWLQAHGVFDYRMAHRLSGIDESPGGQEAQFVAVLDGINPNWRQESPVGLSCLLDTRVYMINQLLRDADAASMAHSLELRVPLVDLEVMGFSRTCDDQFKLSQSGGKGGEYQSSGAVAR